VGEIKFMERGVLTIETDFSDSDFKIEWDKVQFIKSQERFFISISDDLPIYGRLESTSNSMVKIISEDGEAREYDINNIVMLLPVEETFGDRFNASIDLGFSLTKANDLRQYTSRSNIGYKAEKWTSEANFNALRSTQEEADTIRRAETGIIFRYLVYRNWYITASISLLSNTEQKLDMRNNWKLGIGKYFIHTNQSHWGGRIGINRNIERFTSETPDRNSWEIYLGSELDLFDIGDLSMYTNILAFRSVTEAGRWRMDGSFDAKYDLPLDFYIKAGISFNYDNQPAIGASDWDYVIQTGFGWEW